MKKSKYKILVLADLKDSISTTLKSTISLAKMVNGNIDLLYVKNASDVVKGDNQLSAIRTINQEYTTTDKKIKSIIKSYSTDYGVNINYKFSIGNVKNDIGLYIKEQEPDIIVLGKRKPKVANLIGDNITDFVLNNHEGIIMISANENALEPNKELSLGLLNTTREHTFNKAVTGDLISHTQKPLTSFKIVKNSNELKEITSTMDEKIVEYVFEHRDNSIENLSNYVSKNNINLLCIDREKTNVKSGKHAINLEINEIISKLNVSLLLIGKYIMPGNNLI
tara:strand:+ start:29047 stop:29886 length:840 start_codon:yes stop_codon:yes gene_type:complete